MEGDTDGNRTQDQKDRQQPALWAEEFEGEGGGQTGLVRSDSTAPAGTPMEGEVVEPLTPEEEAEAPEFLGRIYAYMEHLRKNQEDRAALYRDLAEDLKLWRDGKL